MPPKEVKELREYLDSLDLKGEQIEPFKEHRVMKRAFFPGGHGLFLGEVAQFPLGETLILGSNFGLYSNFEYNDGNLRLMDEIENGPRGKQSPTWRNLLPLLDKARIIPEKCFYSNVFPVLHKGNDNKLSTKLVDCWLKSETLSNNFYAFLEYTISKMQPRLVMALGMHAARFLNGSWLDKTDRWAISKRIIFPNVSGREIGVNPIIKIPGVKWQHIVTAIPHPSDKRNWGGIPGYEDSDGLARLVSKAAQEAGITMTFVG